MKVKYSGNYTTTIWKGDNCWVFSPNDVLEIPDDIGAELITTGLWEKVEDTSKFSFKKKIEENTE